MKTNLLKTAALFSALVAMTALLSCQQVRAATQPTVITFDDLPEPVNGEIPNGYAGLNWQDFHYYYAVSGYWSHFRGTVVSAPRVAGVNHGAFSSGQPFTLQSAYFAQAYPQLLPRPFTMQGYRGATLRYTRVITQTLTPTLFTFNWTDIDKVQFTMDIDMFCFMDNLSITRGGSDIVATGLAWDAANAGVNFRYDVTGADLTVDTTAALYWATDPNYFGIIGLPAYSTTISRSQGTFGPTYVPLSALSTRPPGTRFLLLVIDPPSPLYPRGLVDEPDESNNLFPLALPGDIRPTDLKIIPEGVQISYVIENADLSDLPYVDLSWDAGSTLPTQTVPAAHIRLRNTAISQPGTSYTEILRRSDFTTPIPPSGYLTHMRAAIDAQDADTSNNSLTARMTITAPQLLSYAIYHASADAGHPDSLEFQSLAFMQYLIDQCLLADFDPRFILAIAGKETIYGRDDPRYRQHFNRGNEPTDTLPIDQLRQIHNYWNVIKYRPQDFPDQSTICTQSEWMRNPAPCQWLASERPASSRVFKIFQGIYAAVQERCAVLSSPNGAYHGYKTIGQIAGVYNPETPDDWKSGVSGILGNLSFPSADNISVVGGDQQPFSPGSVFFKIYSPATLSVVDPFGKFVGQTANGPRVDILGSVVETNGLKIEGIWLPRFDSGVYKLFLLGTGTGSYKLDITFIHPSADFSGTTIEGQITPGEVQEFLINVATNNSSQTTIVQKRLVCNAGGPYVTECDAPLSLVRLNGSGSSDPDRGQLTYQWSSDCPGAVFDDATSPTPTLALDSSKGPGVCTVALTVRNSFGLTSTCSTTNGMMPR